MIKYTTNFAILIIIFISLNSYNKIFFTENYENFTKKYENVLTMVYFPNIMNNSLKKGKKKYPLLTRLRIVLG